MNTILWTVFIPTYERSSRELRQSISISPDCYRVIWSDLIGSLEQNYSRLRRWWQLLELMIWPNNAVDRSHFFPCVLEHFCLKTMPPMFWYTDGILPTYSRQLAAAVCFGVSDLNTGHSEVPPIDRYTYPQVGWNPKKIVGKWVYLLDFIRLLG